MARDVISNPRYPAQSIFCATRQSGNLHSKYCDYIAWSGCGKAVGKARSTMLATLTLAIFPENAALMHRVRYCLGHTHEVICPACLGKDAGPKPRALAHAARHEAPDFSMRMIGPAIGRVGPNHSSAGAVRLGDYGIVGNVDPSALETDAVMAILRLPINIADNRAVRERTT
jgi:hypothetical protein